MIFFLLIYRIPHGLIAMNDRKIYLAGPDVFRKEAKNYFDDVKQMARRLGIEAISPFDGESQPASAREIFEANIRIMNSVNAIMANITPFRGAGIDDGTAFEIGYAYARGLKIYGYSQWHTLSYPEIFNKFTDVMDPDYPLIESFGHPCNLMIAEAILLTHGKIFSSIEECLADFSGKH
jgi:nucleoside 2-deoxyribosyltransferase